MEALFSLFSILYSLFSPSRLSLITAAFVSFAIPLTCNAANTTTWNMMGETKIEGWNTNNLTSVQLIPQGLAVSTQTTGQLIHPGNIRHHVDRISITYISPTGAEGIFFWRAPGMTDNNVYQIPMTFAQTTTSTTLVLDMQKISEWDARSDRIGFVINAGSQLILQRMEFSGPGLTERIVYPAKTFFKLDRARPYTVNFLWGPLMTYSQQQLDALFSNFPPAATSLNLVLYTILGIALLCTLLWKKVRVTVQWRWLVLLTVLLWLLYDGRMGAEFISYSRTDVRTWWSQPLELKDLRDRGSFNAFANTAAPFTNGKQRYVFLASRGWPFIGTMTYLTYPAAPVTPEQATQDTDTWIVYDRPDVQLNEQRQLTINGEPISPSGDIMMQFEPGGFVFVTDTP